MALQKNISMEVTYVADIALKNNKELKQHVEFSDAYILVSEIKGDKRLIIFNMNVYEDREKINFLYSKTYSFTPNVLPNSPNFIQQAYEYLKTLPEYTGAIDVLEEGQML